MLTLWTSTPVGTWDTAVGPAASWATSRCSACENSESTDPRPAGSRRQAPYLQTGLTLWSILKSGWCWGVLFQFTFRYTENRFQASWRHTRLELVSLLHMYYAVQQNVFSSRTNVWKRIKRKTESASAFYLSAWFLELTITWNEK